MGSRKRYWALGRSCVITISALAALTVTGCDGGFFGAGSPPPQAPIAQKPKGLKPPPVTMLPPQDAISVFDEKTFDPKLVRDPFKPFIRIQAPAKTKPKATLVTPTTPLQKFALEDLRFVGILWGIGKNPEALVEDPSGKGYRVKVGTFVGNRGAKISKIQQDQVVVEERLTDVLGEEIVNLTTIKLHKPENEVNQ